MAWLMAAMWSSLKVWLSEVPRWPEVPNATRLGGVVGLGVQVIVGGPQPVDVDERCW